MKLPSFQFYPGDWMKDPALRCVSVSARGVWMDMICLMFEAPRRGLLQHHNGIDISPTELARVIGITAPQVEGVLAELERAGVFSRTEEGTIYSRRLVRDEVMRQRRAQDGKLGGNPAMVARAKAKAVE